MAPLPAARKGSTVEGFHGLAHADTWHAEDVPGDALRGVSVHYLSTHFIADIEEAGFTRENTIHDIEKVAIRGKGAALACPRDGKIGTAFVDALDGPDNVGPSNFMLSYTWGYTVDMIVASLVEYCERKQLDPKRTYIWMCCLCINQHRVVEAQKKGEQVPFETFSREFSSRVKGIGHVLSLMGPWHAPKYIERCWCIFELSIAMSVRCKCEILMPPSEMDSFTVALMAEDGSAINRVWELLHNVCIKRAEASVAADKEHIMRFIDSGPGLMYFNNQVRSKLESWFVGTAEERIYALCRASKCCKVIHTVRTTASLLQEVGEFERALRLVQDCLEHVPQDVCADAKATLLYAEGRAQRLCSDTKASWASLGAALEIREEAGTVETADGAALLSEMAATQVLRDDLQGALESVHRARRIHEDLGSAEAPTCAGLAAEVSMLEAALGETTASTQEYFAARRMQKSAGSVTLPGGLHFPLIYPQNPSCEFFFRTQKQILRAEQMCENFRATGNIERVHGAFALFVRGYLKANLGESEDAQESVLEACAIYSSLGLLTSSPFGLDALMLKGHIQQSLGDDEGTSETYMEEKAVRALLPCPEVCGMELPFSHQATDALWEECMQTHQAVQAH
mmetsp:Transcript_88479/g.228136  ORF Transcript_88479/g.228136 Transcript_88479/m.228136 type:complete len:627 (-) Transcript_88479:318-2198(-)